MVSWRAGLGLLVVLVALGALAVLTRPQPASRAPAPAFLGCSGRQAVDILIAGGGRVTELERHAPGDSWRVAQPGPSAADSRSVETLVSSIDSIKVLNTIGRPQ